MIITQIQQDMCLGLIKNILNLDGSVSVKELIYLTGHNEIFIENRLKRFNS